MTRAAPELGRQARRPPPLGEVGVDDGHVVRPPRGLGGGPRARHLPDRGQVSGIEVRVHDDQRGDPLPLQSRGHVLEQGGEGGRTHRDRAREAGGKRGGGVGDGREQHGAEAEAAETVQRSLGGRPRDHHVRNEGQVRTVSLDGACRQQRHDAFRRPRPLRPPLVDRQARAGKVRPRRAAPVAPVAGDAMTPVPRATAPGHRAHESQRSIDHASIATQR